MPRRKQITLALPPDVIDAIDAERGEQARQRWIEHACRMELEVIRAVREDALETDPSPQSAGRPAGESSDGRNGGRDPDRAGTSPEAAGKTTLVHMTEAEQAEADALGIPADSPARRPIRVVRESSTESGGRLHGVSPPLDGPVSQGETPKSASSPTPSEDVPNREIWVHQRAAELGLFMPQGAAAEQAASEYDEQFGETTF
jgi:hypothetical protein